MTWGDQQILNKFAQENNRKHALTSQITKLKELITSLTDAQEELELDLDNETARYRVGEVYMVMDKDETVSALESKIASHKRKLNQQEDELSEILGRLAAYKRELYSKFGTDNINLED